MLYQVHESSHKEYYYYQPHDPHSGIEKIRQVFRNLYNNYVLYFVNLKGICIKSAWQTHFRNT